MFGLRTLCLDVVDLHAAKQFYAAVLGRPPYFDQPFYVGFDVDGYELGLRPTTGAPSVLTYLAVHDVDAEVARLEALGAKRKEAPQDVGEHIVVASVEDPFGHTIGLIRNLHFAPKLVTAAVDDVSEREIRHERVIEKSRREVWRLFTTSDGVSSWLAGRAHIELRPGGKYEVYFLVDNVPGEQGSEGCRVLSFLPERMLSFTWNAPPHLTRVRHEHTWVVVELFAVNDHETRLVLTHAGWPRSGLAAEPQWEEAFAYFTRAWGGALDDLVAFARTGKRP